jgi:hypothetical protein
MKKILGIVCLVMGVILFCSMHSTYFGGNGADGPRQNIEIGMQGKPWLAFNCTKFVEESPTGCEGWEKSIYWRTPSWVGLLLIITGIRLQSMSRAKEDA